MIYSSKFWHECEREDLTKTLFRHVEALDSQLGDYHSYLKRCAMLYSGRDELGYEWTTRFRGNFSSTPKFNIIQTVVDSTNSVIAKSSVRLRAQTRDGDYSEIIQAKKLEQMLYGEYLYHNESQRMIRMFLDAAIGGTGILRQRIVDGMVVPERVLPKDFLTDENTVSLDGYPLEVFIRTLVNKEVLKSYYPRFCEQIDENARFDWADRTNTIPQGFCVLVEAWRLPTGNKKGRYVMAIENCVLESSEYKYKKFPFVFYHWKAPETGFYGTGICQMLESHQARIEAIDDRITQAQDLVAVPMGFLPEGSQVLKDQITNDVARLYPVTGGIPQFIVPTAANAELYNHRSTLIQECFQMVGLSQYNSQALAPPNIESRAALRELDDVQNTRFIQEVRRFERAHVDLGWRRLEQMRNLHLGRDRDGLLGEIDWRKVSEYDNRFTLTVAPASIMSETPAGRLDMVRELSGVVQMSPQEIRFLLGNPDLEFANNLSTADYEHAIRVAEKLSQGDYEAPDILANPELHLRIITQAYTRAKNAGAPEEVLQGFRDYLDQAATEFVPTPPPAPTAADAAAQAGQSIAPPLSAPVDLSSAGV